MDDLKNVCEGQEMCVLCGAECGSAAGNVCFVLRRLRICSRKCVLCVEQIADLQLEICVLRGADCGSAAGNVCFVWRRLLICNRKFVFCVKQIADLQQKMCVLCGADCGSAAGASAGDGRLVGKCPAVELPAQVATAPYRQLYPGRVPGTSLTNTDNSVSQNILE